jgi:anti-sigma factor RsiW
MNCKRAQEAISRFLDEQLDPTAQNRLNRHLERCNECSSYLDDLREGLAALRDLPFEEPSPNFEWNLKRRLPEAVAEQRVLARHRRPNRFWSPFAISAAAVLLLSLGSASVWYSGLGGGGDGEPMRVLERDRGGSHLGAWPRPMQNGNSGVVPVGDSTHELSSPRNVNTIDVANPGVDVAPLRGSGRVNAEDSLAERGERRR